MQKLIFLFAAVALFGATLYLTQQKEHSLHFAGIPHDVAKMFKEWKVTYGKNYPTLEVEAYKLGVFYANYQKVQQHNADTTQTYKLGINQFMDMTPQEFSATMLGGIVDPNPDVEFIHDNEDTATAPASVNWVTAGKVSAVKNQGQCGSCWAFSCTGSNESCDAIFGSGVGDFSEQQLVDCSWLYGDEGCNGGNYFWANKYIIQYGITTEQAYPYTGADGVCKTQGGAWKISSQTMCSPNSCAALQTAIVQQPTSVQVAAETWQLYVSGILSNCGTQIDHDVLAVGYVANSYWLIKNSWGTTWGENGYIQLAWGNTCQVCSQCGYPNK